MVPVMKMKQSHSKLASRSSKHRKSSIMVGNLYNLIVNISSFSFFFILKELLWFSQIMLNLRPPGNFVSESGSIASILKWVILFKLIFKCSIS